MIESRLWKFGGILPLLGALVGLTGCPVVSGEPGVSTSDEVAEQPLVEAPSKGGAPSAANDADRARGDSRGHRGGRHGFGNGPEHLLSAALHELDLSDAQEATIKGALEGLHDGAKDRPKDPAVFAALAEGVRAGAIDKDAVKAKLAAGEPGMAERRAKIAAALTTLHETLTKEQRRELVDAIAEKMDKHGDKGERDGKGERGDKGERGHGPMDGHMKGGPLGHLLGELNLTEGQRAQVDKALEAARPAAEDRDAMKKDFEAKRTEMRARLETFAAGSFDANAFLPASKEGGEGPQAHLGRMVDALSAIVPILDKDQRAALADRLEKGPPAGKFGGECGEKGMRGGERGARSTDGADRR